MKLSKLILPSIYCLTIFSTLLASPQQANASVLNIIKKVVAIIEEPTISETEKAYTQYIQLNPELNIYPEFNGTDLDNIETLSRYYTEEEMSNVFQGFEAEWTLVMEGQRQTIEDIFNNYSDSSYEVKYALAEEALIYNRGVFIMFRTEVLTQESVRLLYEKLERENNTNLYNDY